MAEINLLKQSSNSQNLLGALPKLLAFVFGAILICVIGYYGWLIYDLKNLENKVLTLQTRMAKEKQEGFSADKRDEVLTRQLQIKSLDGLIKTHLYWSQIFPKLADVTLKKAAYSNLKIDATGVMSITVTVPAIEDLDKFMQVFDQPKYYKDFYDIRISGFSKVQDKVNPAIRFDVKMKYNPDIVKYNEDNKGN